MWGVDVCLKKSFKVSAPMPIPKLDLGLGSPNRNLVLVVHTLQQMAKKSRKWIFFALSIFTIIKEITSAAADIKVNTADSSLNC